VNTTHVEDAVRPMTQRDRIVGVIETLHDEATVLVNTLDHGGAFREDKWERPGGGGGVTRVLLEGRTFEKAGVNRSVVSGVLPPEEMRRLGVRASLPAPAEFFAAGISVVIHPWSPMVPTLHLNVRYFEIVAPGGPIVDWWFGGGTDLTLYYPMPEDARHFHVALKTICDRYHHSYYSRFKTWCDNYFVNTHRGDERRGIGGIFFDNLRPGESGLDFEQLLGFVMDVGRSMSATYAPIVDRCRNFSYGDRERRFQLARRGRYVEFNLVHDRGTVFGLRTGARIESVLMSLPPLAAWDYAPEYEPGSFEAELMAMLEPREWVAG
jgi:coproporphyrinogen III oxidase